MSSKASVATSIVLKKKKQTKSRSTCWGNISEYHWPVSSKNDVWLNHSSQTPFYNKKSFYSKLEAAKFSYNPLSPVQTDTTLSANVGSCCVHLHVAKGSTVFKHCATSPNNMQQDVQTDTTCNIQQCWELLANNVLSIYTGLYSVKQILASVYWYNLVSVKGWLFILIACDGIWNLYVKIWDEMPP